MSTPMTRTAAAIAIHQAMPEDVTSIRMGTCISMEMEEIGVCFVIHPL
jgi:hypothetical protein